jgi:transposase
MAQGKAWNKEEVTELLKPYLEGGMSVRGACQQIGIPQQTVDTWIQNDEELQLKVTSWKNKRVLKALSNIGKSLDEGDINTSKWFAERVLKTDFSTRSEVVGAIGITGDLPEDLKNRSQEIINDAKRESLNAGSGQPLNSETWGIDGQGDNT